MKCQICEKETNFLEWFIFNYCHRECLKKEKEKHKKVKEKINEPKFWLHVAGIFFYFFLLTIYNSIIIILNPDFFKDFEFSHQEPNFFTLSVFICIIIMIINSGKKGYLYFYNRKKNKYLGYFVGIFILAISIIIIINLISLIFLF